MDSHIADVRTIPALSIIVPTLNRGPIFRRTVEQVLQQRFDDYELIVVDQSDEPERSINEAFARDTGDHRLRYLQVSRKNLPNARNEGVARARGHIILFLDDDVVLLETDFLDAHVDAYADPRVGGVTGRTIERSLRSNSFDTAMHVTWGGRTVINLAGTSRTTVAGLKGANMSFRADLFKQLGGFDRNFIGSAILEDVDFSFRATAAGWRLIFEPRAELLHLSAAAGGVRVADEIMREGWRFQLTCYFVLKHRGLMGLLPFGATFGLIGLIRALRWLRPDALVLLWAACKRGWFSWKCGPDESIAHGLERQPPEDVARRPAAVAW